MSKKTKEKPEEYNISSENLNENNHLILHNDDVHTFDYVIDTLIDVCNHDAEQAEQCAYITHYKGKCDVKSGSKDFLKPLRLELINKGLNATIE